MKKILNIFKIADLRTKVIFTISILLVYRLGGQVRVPFIDSNVIKDIMGQAAATNPILGLYDTFVGGFLSQASIFTLGIMPYISASIVIQLMGAVVPYFQRLQKEGELGRKKITQLTRYGTVLLATMQSFGIATLLYNDIGVTNLGSLVTTDNVSLFFFVTMVTLVTGTIFVMWLGEQITDYGIGNGISLIIMAGIISRMPAILRGEYLRSSVDATGNELGFGQILSNNALLYTILIVLIFVITLFTVLVNTGTRKIPVQYAKRVIGRKVYGGQDSHIPLKILTAGVMPIIFAQALMFIPSTIASFFDPNGDFALGVTNYLAPTTWTYCIIFSILIIVFTYFYTAISFNPVDVADNLKKSSGHIPGVRPGKATSDYIDNILTSVTLPASIFLAFIAIVPVILFKSFNGADADMNSAETVSYGLLSFYGGTSLIIIVGVALDTLQQIESHMIMRNYDGFLKSGRLRGRRRY